MVPDLVTSGQLPVDNNSVIDSVSVSGNAGIQVVQYLIEQRGYAVTDELILIAVHSNNLNIAQYLISRLGKPHHYYYHSSFRNYTNSNKLTVSDVNILHHIYGDKLTQILPRLNRIQSKNDNGEVYTTLIGKVTSKYFEDESVWKYERFRDNIRCVSIIYGQSSTDKQDKMLATLSDGQLHRLKHYLQ